MPKVLLTSNNENGKTQGGINGRAFSVPHNTPTTVTEDELAVLKDMSQPGVTFEELPDDADAEDAQVVGATAGGGLGFAPESAQGPATPASIDGTDVAPAASSAGASPEVETSGLASGQEGADPLGVSEQSNEDSSATAESDEQPTDQQTEAQGDDQQDDSGSTRTNKTFDAEAFINRTVDEISNDIDGLSPEQIDAVIAAEKDREKPRSTLMEKLEAAKA